MSAVFRAGASLTPSPVIATTSPLDCHALTILTLCSGETLAYTAYLCTFFSNSSCGIFSSSAPVIAMSPSSKIPISLAIATAVTLWSPVIITGLIPAVLHFTTASFASGLAGSIIPTIPINTKSLSAEGISLCSGTASITLYAIARTLNAFEPSSLFTLEISSK